MGCQTQRSFQHLLHCCCFLAYFLGSCCCQNVYESVADQHAWHHLLHQRRSLVKQQAPPSEWTSLLHFKTSLQDPAGILSQWGTRNTDLCSWTGLNCTTSGHVQAILLNNRGFSGWLTLDWILSLPFLQLLDLSDNQLMGNLSALSSTSLQDLNLAGNLLTGDIPVGFMTDCPNIRSLNLSDNSIDGSLLPELFIDCATTQLQYLDLSNNRISGNLPPNMFLCQSLLHLDLSHNRISDGLPPTLLSNCSACSSGPRLLFLDLSNNNFSGAVPDQFFSNCASLLSLDLSDNLFSGSIPSSLQNCIQLFSLNLTNNRFDPSPLPDFLSKLINIRKLHLSNNKFVGSIPVSFGSAFCSTLQELEISGNNLTGSIPSSFSACNYLQVLNVANNKLSGSFPGQIIASLQSIEVLRFAFNSFTGPMPVGVMNGSRLRILDLGGNFLTGPLPPEICPSVNNYVLEQLLLSNNGLSGVVPAALSNCTGLVIIDLSFNQLQGSIPSELSSLRNLERLSLWYNGLTGEIPAEIGNLSRLKNLNLNNNLLSGSIPSQLSQCTDLEWLNLNSNKLTGSIPPELGLLQKLTLLELGNNSLTGPIPSELGNCSSLLWLDLNTNQLSGNIPKALGRHASGALPSPVLVGNMLAYVRNGVSSCEGFGMGIMLDFTGMTVNSLTDTPFTACPGRPTVYVGGSLYDNPDNRTIQYLDLSFNQLSGSIPDEMGSWVSLVILALSHNQLTGFIPSSFANLHIVGVMDLSHNQLEGTLSVLASCTLLVGIDVSNNDFSGEIPNGQLSTNSIQSFANNSGLCGPPLPGCGGSAGAAPSNSQACTGASCVAGNRFGFLSLANSVVMGVLVALLCVGAFVVWMGFMMKNRSKTKENALLSSLQQSSCNGSSSWNLSGEREPLSINVATFERPLRKLTFSQLIEATNGFSKESLVGTGGFGEVYKAELKDGSVVAIKKLVRFSFQGDREFTAEMETLGKIKHRNLVPLLGYCKVGEERLLVYEYMQGGSLEEVLHGTSDGRERLTWDLRKQIAKGAARGLAFLHHNCIPHIIHRDMKSSNVLLDKDLEARVSDFGMARLISALDTHLSVSTLAGTPGYVPPEYYQSFRCTTKGDVYSFGVILLELVTGQRPTDKEEFGDNNLVGWVKLHVENKNSLEVLDPALRGTGAEYEMIQYLNIACDCLDDVPARRPTMLRVVAMLKELVFDNQNSG